MIFDDFIKKLPLNSNELTEEDIAVQQEIIELYSEALKAINEYFLSIESDQITLDFELDELHEIVLPYINTLHEITHPAAARITSLIETFQERIMFIAKPNATFIQKHRIVATTYKKAASVSPNSQKQALAAIDQFRTTRESLERSSTNVISGLSRLFYETFSSRFSPEEVMEGYQIINQHITENLSDTLKLAAQYKRELEQVKLFHRSIIDRYMLTQNFFYRSDQETKHSTREAIGWVDYKKLYGDEAYNNYQKLFLAYDRLFRSSDSSLSDFQGQIMNILRKVSQQVSRFEEVIQDGLLPVREEPLPVFLNETQRKEAILQSLYAVHLSPESLNSSFNPDFPGITINQLIEQVILPQFGKSVFNSDQIDQQKEEVRAILEAESLNKTYHPQKKPGHSQLTNSIHSGSLEKPFFRWKRSISEMVKQKDTRGQIRNRRITTGSNYDIYSVNPYYAPPKFTFPCFSQTELAQFAGLPKET